MCGRFTITTGDRQRLAQRFGFAGEPDAALLERVNVAPTEPVLAVGADRRMRALSWGIRPPWSDRPLINARSETVASKRPFAELVRAPEHRCLVLADGFYEWLRAEDGRRARPAPFRFALAGSEPFAFAGLWRDGECTILTCAPNPLVARLHDRMPVILGGAEEEAAWLSEDLRVDDLGAVLRALPEERMTCEAADPAVNRAGEPAAAAAAAGPTQEALF